MLSDFQQVDQISFEQQKSKQPAKLEKAVSGQDPAIFLYNALLDAKCSWTKRKHRLIDNSAAEFFKEILYLRSQPQNAVW